MKPAREVGPISDHLDRKVRFRPKYSPFTLAIVISAFGQVTKKLTSVLMVSVVGALCLDVARCHLLEFTKMQLVEPNDVIYTYQFSLSNYYA